MNTNTEDEGYALFDDPTGKIPPALAKAFVDPFSYALGLRDGRVILFMEADLLEGGKWVHLIGHGDNGNNTNGVVEMSGVDYPFDRGLDVRLSDIMWVADAPNGS